ncbi:MAG: hypothetical protein ACKVHL_01660 [Rhodospirillales bacterium]|jgi:hypothetical protein
MADRISLADTDKPEPLQRILFDSAAEILGHLPNSFLIGAHVPFIQMMMMPFTASLQRQGGGGILTTRLKEMAVVKTSHLNGCNY